MTPSRRAVLHSVGWGVPAVALASSAPAYATSGDPRGVFVMANGSKTPEDAETFQVVSAGAASGVVLTITQAHRPWTASGLGPGSDATFSPVALGPGNDGVTRSGMLLQHHVVQDPSRTESVSLRTTYTFSLSQPVKEVALTLAGIDGVGVAPDLDDYVRIQGFIPHDVPAAIQQWTNNPSTYQPRVSLPASESGSGLTDARTHLHLSRAEAVSSFEVIWWFGSQIAAGDSAPRFQEIAVSDISFTLA